MVRKSYNRTSGETGRPWSLLGRSTGTALVFWKNKQNGQYHYEPEHHPLMGNKQRK